MNFTDRPPSFKELKQHFIDRRQGQFSAKTLNCVARQILSIKDPDEVMRIGLEFLVEELSASRADGGFASPGDKVYQPATVCSRGHGSSDDLRGVRFSNTARLFQEAWKYDLPVVCNDVSSSPLLDDSREQFQAVNSQAVLMQRLSLGGKPVGMACVDVTHSHQDWSKDQIRLMSDFCAAFLGPMVGISRHWHGCGPSKLMQRPSPSQSELEVIRCAALGMSYKQIANELGKSVRTVENQLRSARNRLDAANQVDLIRKCEIWV